MSKLKINVNSFFITFVQPKTETKLFPKCINMKLKPTFMYHTNLHKSIIILLAFLFVSTALIANIEQDTGICNSEIEVAMIGNKEAIKILKNYATMSVIEKDKAIQELLVFFENSSFEDGEAIQYVELFEELLNNSIKTNVLFEHNLYKSDKTFITDENELIIYSSNQKNISFVKPMLNQQVWKTTIEEQLSNNVRIKDFPESNVILLESVENYYHIKKILLFDRIDGNLLWSFTENEKNYSIRSKYDIVEDVIYFGSHKTMKVVNFRNGEMLWEYDPESIDPGVYCVEDNIIYADIYGKGKVQALDFKKKKTIWEYGKRISFVHNLNGHFYSSQNNYASALNKKTGQLSWETELESSGFGVFKNQILENKLIISNSKKPTVYAVKLDDGELLWSQTFNIYGDKIEKVNVEKSTILVKNGNRNIIYGIDFETGELKWKRIVNKKYVTLYYSDRNFVTFYENDKVICININNGKEIVIDAKYPLDLNDNYLIVKTDDKLICYDLIKQTKIWQLSNVNARNAMIDDHILYVGNLKNISVLNLKTGQELNKVNLSFSQGYLKLVKEFNNNLFIKSENKFRLIVINEQIEFLISSLGYDQKNLLHRCIKSNNNKIKTVAEERMRVLIDKFKITNEFEKALVCSDEINSRATVYEEIAYINVDSCKLDLAKENFKNAGKEKEGNLIIANKYLELKDYSNAITYFINGGEEEKEVYSKIAKVCVTNEDLDAALKHYGLLGAEFPYKEVALELSTQNKNRKAAEFCILSNDNETASVYMTKAVTNEIMLFVYTKWPLIPSNEKLVEELSKKYVDGNIEIANLLNKDPFSNTYLRKPLLDELTIIQRKIFEVLEKATYGDAGSKAKLEELQTINEILKVLVKI